MSLLQRWLLYGLYAARFQRLGPDGWYTPA